MGEVAAGNTECWLENVMAEQYILQTDDDDNMYWISLPILKCV